MDPVVLEVVAVAEHGDAVLADRGRLVHADAGGAASGWFRSTQGIRSACSGRA
jgi:hypothetical protein